MTDDTPTNPQDRVAAALERIASALERAHPDPALTLRGNQFKVTLRYPDDVTSHGQAASNAWQPSMPDAASRELERKLAATAAMRAMVDTIIPPNVDGGWTEWHGGVCPVSLDTLVDVRYRALHPDDGVPSGERARMYQWMHFDGPENGDIVAYRLAK